MGKNNFLNLFRRWGRRKPADDFVHVEFSDAAPDPITAEGASTASVETLLLPSVTHCWNRVLRPALQEFTAENGLLADPSMRALFIAGLAAWLLLAGSSLIHLVAALVLPGWRTARALEFGSSTERRRWLQYWIVYGVVGVVSAACYPLLNLFPVIWTAKTALLLWCAAPYPWHGSAYVCCRLIAPLARRIDHLQLLTTGGAAAGTPANRRPSSVDDG